MNGLARAALAGCATGARSMCALAACANTPGRQAAPDRWLHSGPVPRSTAAAAGFELIGDKLPAAPPRTDPPAFAARVALGALTGSVVATRSGESSIRGAVIGLVTATASTWAGPKVRARLAARFGRDLPGALAEDAAAFGLAALAVRA